MEGNQTRKCSWNFGRGMEEGGGGAEKTKEETKNITNLVSRFEDSFFETDFRSGSEKLKYRSN